MPRPLRASAAPLVTFIVVTAALYFAQPILMPIALAMLLAFWTAPLVTRVECLGVGRIAAIIAVCLGLLGVVGGLGWIVVREAAQLSEDVPAMRRNLVDKAHSLRGPIGTVVRASAVLEELEQELDVPDGPRPERTEKVEVVQRTNVLATLRSFAAPLLVPLGTAAAVLVLMIFLLVAREELRDRVVRLAGENELTITTQALDDAGRRLSRFLGAQSLLCTAHGAMVALGLFAIGLEGALLWGVLAGLLRFIPYVGPWISALLPIGLSLAAFPGWSPALATIGLFVVVELISNNVLEPWLHGTRTGLSPFAVVLSAFFWTWLWGLPGLFLATPLTVCLVVAGRYVESLSFVRVLFGDEQALDPAARFYQRVLSLDANESAQLLRQATEGQSLEAVSESIVLPAVRWLERDLERAAVTRERARRIRDLMAALFDDLAPEPGDEASGPSVLVIAGREEPEWITAAWLAVLLAARGFRVRRGSRAAVAGPLVAGELICVSALGAAAALHARR
ncbi:MAG: AI-2E family transporter, partial [Proteobacteria bacterium]